MREPLSMREIEAMPVAQFVQCFGDVAEQSPWVAEEAASRRPFRHIGGMVDAFAAAVRAAPLERQLELLRAHPDLAARAKRMADNSRREQSGAGLDSLSADEFARFTGLNERYRAKFGFPFIFAVKGATREQILAAFAERIGNSPEHELHNAISQICRIMRFRLEERVAQ